MNHLALAVALTLTVASATHANDLQIGPNGQDYCREVNNLAAAIMEKRQRGALMADMVDAVGEDGLTLKIVRTAYDAPRYQTPTHQNRAITDFANEWYAACLEAIEEREEAH